MYMWVTTVLVRPTVVCRCNTMTCIRLQWCVGANHVMHTPPVVWECTPRCSSTGDVGVNIMPCIHLQWCGTGNIVVIIVLCIHLLAVLAM